MKFNDIKQLISEALLKPASDDDIEKRNSNRISETINSKTTTAKYAIDKLTQAGMNPQPVVNLIGVSVLGGKNEFLLFDPTSETIDKVIAHYKMIENILQTSIDNGMEVSYEKSTLSEIDDKTLSKQIFAYVKYIDPIQNQKFYILNENLNLNIRGLRIISDYEKLFNKSKYADSLIAFKDIIKFLNDNEVNFFDSKFYKNSNIKCDSSQYMYKGFTLFNIKTNKSKEYQYDWYDLVNKPYVDKLKTDMQSFIDENKTNE